MITVLRKQIENYGEDDTSFKLEGVGNSSKVTSSNMIMEYLFTCYEEVMREIMGLYEGRKVRFGDTDRIETPFLRFVQMFLRKG